MHRRLPPLNALKSFEAAARHLSFTKAADELFVTQAAVSHQIKALEDFLSMKLFLRRNRTLLLTEEGQAYFLELKDIFKNLQDATERLLAKGSKGAITVAMPPSFASQWLVPRIHKFSLAHPDIDRQRYQFRGRILQSGPWDRRASSRLADGGMGQGSDTPHIHLKVSSCRTTVL